MKNYIKPLLILILISVLVRTIFATITELGNDEVYYRIFGLYPSLSYFDHPPLLAWLIRLTTFASQQPTEILVRLSSIIIGAINTYLIYIIAGGARRGFFAAMLYTGSIYASVILGLFILPDTPLSLFWLLTLAIFIKILPIKFSSKNNSKMLLAGVTIGFAMLSKYTGAYLWVAAAAYIIIFNRAWLRSWALYLAPIVSLVIFLPVIIWNFQNDFISFTFHSARVTAESSINWLYFGRELLGGIFYNNPINYILIITALALFFRLRKSSQNFIDRQKFWLLIIFSVPMILMFTSISLTRATLPHWAAPAFFALIILAAFYLDHIAQSKALRWIWSSVGLTVIVITTGTLQINYGLFDLSGGSKEKSMAHLGRNDVTLDMYGWRQLGEKFSKIRQSDIANGVMPASAEIVSYRWDEAAHIDSYVALPQNIKLTTLTGKENTHFYHWISEWRGKYQVGSPAYLLISSRLYNPDAEIFALLGVDHQKRAADTIVIERGGSAVEAFMLYRIGDIGEID